MNGLKGSPGLTPTQYMWILLPVMILVNFIRSLKNLGPFSAVANVLQSVGMIIVLYYIIRGPYSTNLNVYTAPIERLPLFFGTAMYAFEGIGVVSIFFFFLSDL